MFEFAAKTFTPDASLKACEDCRHLKGFASLWCTNKEAVRRRGTAIPGTVHCPQWAPIMTMNRLGFWKRLMVRFNPRYIKV